MPIVISKEELLERIQQLPEKCRIVAVGIDCGGYDAIISGQIRICVDPDTKLALLGAFEDNDTFNKTWNSAKESYCITRLEFDRLRAAVDKAPGPERRITAEDVCKALWNCGTPSSWDYSRLRKILTDPACGLLGDQIIWPKETE